MDNSNYNSAMIHVVSIINAIPDIIHIAGWLANVAVMIAAIAFLGKIILAYIK